MLGPGKLQLLALLDQTGSISAAARDMGVTYRRAWFLLETLQACFRAPLFETTRGGAGKGGTTLTDTGRALVDQHAVFEQATTSAAAPFLQWLESQQSDEQQT